MASNEGATATRTHHLAIAAVSMHTLESDTTPCCQNAVHLTALYRLSNGSVTAF